MRLTDSSTFCLMEVAPTAVSDLMRRSPFSLRVLRICSRHDSTSNHTPQ